MASTHILDCVTRDRNRKDKDLKFLVRDHSNSCVFRVDDSGSNKDGKRKVVLECSSRSSVSETEESLLTSSSNPNPTSSPLETNSFSFNNPSQTENQSRNEITIGASSLLHSWEAKSSSSHSQSLIDRRKSSGLSLFVDSESINNSSEEIASYEKEREGTYFLGVVTCTPRIRGRQAYEDFYTMILRDRKEELESIASSCPVSKFSPRRCGRLQFMLRIRCLESCIAVQEKHQLSRRYKKNKGKVNNVVEARVSSSRPVSSQEKKDGNMAKKAAEKNVLREYRKEVKGTMEKSNMREATSMKKLSKKALGSEIINNKNGIKEPEIEKDGIIEGERSKEIVEKAIAKESLAGKKTSLSIAEKVYLWDSIFKNRTNSYMEATENKKEEVSSFEQRKSIETEEYRISCQEVTSAIRLDKREEKENESQVSRKSDQEEESSQDNEETLKAEKLDTLCLIFESPKYLNGWDENKLEDGQGEEEEEEYNEESEYPDWVNDISQPRSYWEDLREQWEQEVMNYEEPEKEEIQNMIKKRTVSSILASDLREKINKILIAHTQRRLQVESNLVEEQDSEESLVKCSESYQEKLEGNETVRDGFSQNFARSAKWSFEGHEAAIIVSSNPKDHDNTSTEFKTICDLQEQIRKLQIEMLELRSLVESRVDFKESVKSESVFVSDSLKRSCSI